MNESRGSSTTERATAKREGIDAGMEGRMHLILSVALASIVVGGTADLLMDAPTTWLSFHVVFETLMIAGALVMATTLWLGWWQSAHDAVALRESLQEQSAERDRWRISAQQALEGLGQAIDAQFETWHLTPAEREVAFLILKGYGHKQIAGRTGRSERTVRQHAGVVYEKSGLGGRAELSAFFLQDVMVPDDERTGVSLGGSTQPTPGAAASGMLLALALAIPGLVTAQDHPHGGRPNAADSIGIPASIRAEHEEIHGQLVAATKATGAVGSAARDLAAVLHPHFVREEQIALPPLSLLSPLARGEWSGAMRNVLPLADSLRAELPRMLDEHRAIHAATMRLRDAARTAGNAAVARFAERLALHARSEEEIFYPAALFVGELVRARATTDGRLPSSP